MIPIPPETAATREPVSSIHGFKSVDVRVGLDGREYIVRLTVREDANIDGHYDHHLTDVAVLQEPVAQPTHIANAGEEQQALAKDKLYQWWYEVNADIESLRAWA